MKDKKPFYYDIDILFKLRLRFIKRIEKILINLYNQLSDNNRFTINIAILKSSFYEKFKFKLKIENKVDKVDILSNLRNFSKDIFTFT